MAESVKSKALASGKRIGQVKRDEHALRAPEKQITEHRPPIIINASYVDVEDRAFNAIGGFSTDPSGVATTCQPP